MISAIRNWLSPPSQEPISLSKEEEDYRTEINDRHRTVGVITRIAHHWLSQPKLELHSYQQRLLKIARSSRFSEKHQIAAANAVSILNAMGFSFQGLKLNGIRIPKANLSGAILEKVDLTDSDLSHVNFSESTLRGAILDGANLQGIFLGKHPYLFHEKTVLAACISPNGEILATHDTSNLYIWDIETLELLGKSDDNVNISLLEPPYLTFSSTGTTLYRGFSQEKIGYVDVWLVSPLSKLTSCSIQGVSFFDLIKTTADSRYLIAVVCEGITSIEFPSDEYYIQASGSFQFQNNPASDQRTVVQNSDIRIPETHAQYFETHLPSFFPARPTSEISRRGKLTICVFGAKLNEDRTLQLYPIKARTIDHGGNACMSTDYIAIAPYYSSIEPITIYSTPDLEQIGEFSLSTNLETGRLQHIACTEDGSNVYISLGNGVFSFNPYTQESTIFPLKETLSAEGTSQKYSIHKIAIVSGKFLLTHASNSLGERRTSIYDRSDNDRLRCQVHQSRFNRFDPLLIAPQRIVRLSNFIATVDSPEALSAKESESFLGEIRDIWFYNDNEIALFNSHGEIYFYHPRTGKEIAIKQPLLSYLLAIRETSKYTLKEFQIGEQENSEKRRRIKVFSQKEERLDITFEGSCFGHYLCPFTNHLLIGFDRTIELWDLPSKSKVGSIQLKSERIDFENTKIAFSPDFEHIVIIQNSSMDILKADWKNKSANLFYHFNRNQNSSSSGLPSMVNVLAFVNDNFFFAIDDSTGDSWGYDIRDLAEKFPRKELKPGSFSLSTKANIKALIMRDKLNVIDTRNNKIICEMSFFEPLQYSTGPLESDLHHIKLSPDGKLFVCWNQNRIYTWEINERQLTLLWKKPITLEAQKISLKNVKNLSETTRKIIEQHQGSIERGNQ